MPGRPPAPTASWWTPSSRAPAAGARLAPTADPNAQLPTDRRPRFGRWDGKPLYTPHNSGADNYPFLIITSYLTDPALYRGRMREMLRNEVRYTDVDGGKIPGDLRLDTHQLGPASFFGAGEYCKDGMVPVTELLGRTPGSTHVGYDEDFLHRAPSRPLGQPALQWRRAQRRCPPDPHPA